jgi:hypothetical protein
MSVRDKTASEIADLIERFVSDRPSHWREWHDFVDGHSIQDSRLNSFRKQCGVISDQFQSDRKTLDPSREERWQDAEDQLRKIAMQLRKIE